MDAETRHNGVFTSLGDVSDLSYKHLATIRSFDQIENRMTFTREIEMTIPVGMEYMTAAKKIEIVRTNIKGDRNFYGYETINFDVYNQERHKIYRAKILKKWNGLNCEVHETDRSNLVLSIILRNTGFGCCRKTVVTVHFGKTVLGSVVFRGDNGLLYNPDGYRILKILTRLHEADRVEHAIVQVDNTSVGHITSKSLKFTKCIDVNERALLFGAWISIGLKHILERKTP